MVMAKCKIIHYLILLVSIGTRELWFIYKQRFRPADNRESVIVNKLALEYRKIRSLGFADETSALAV